MNGCLSSTLLLVLIVCSTAGVLSGQSADALKNKRAELLAEINANNRRLGDTRRNKAATVEQLALLQQQIRKRAELITTLQQEITHTDASIIRTNEVVFALNEDVERLQEEYSHLVRAAYRSRLQNTWLSFLLSSRSFNEAFRRWQYLRQYQRFRSRQARLIVATQKSLQTKLTQLEVRRTEKEKLLQTEENQRLAISREKGAQDQLLTKLNKSEANILTEIKQQEIAREELNQAIEESIASEMARIRKAERNRTTTTAAAPASSNVATPEVSNEASNFSSQKGRLPWPVEGEIVKRFGRQPHPTVKGVEISNNGIDIGIKTNTTVKAVAAGTVVSTHFVPGYRNMVLVRHGDYYTVYSNLESVNVSSGTSLSAGQTIGNISTQAGELHFELWRQKERLNPERWISK
ncbi:MAG: murein hydrolase activator EnvC family protein [Lewinella sp.]|uniref:murein hydrolase activator EnvC family protein n=1 Tax=Lewinella sp. TaxID=2004506 RepID=UPI003D6A6E4A